MTATANFSSVPPNPPGSWSTPITFDRDGPVWSCHGSTEPEADCIRFMMHCERPPAPASDEEVLAANPAKHAPACMKKARALVKKGSSCGIDMGKYSAERVCAYYLVREPIPDADVARRLQVLIEGGCEGLRAAVDGDRI